ncbi:glycoside hydrolase [Prolixibacteraceae bacterium JC049]|nr:glycoside hydrolase [Prolixibacteraceae bacterium JC049]
MIKNLLMGALLLCCVNLYAQRKVDWKPMLDYTLQLHKKSTHKAQYPFERDWEEIGPGYCYGPAFGHWDVVHQILDALVYDEQHAIDQLYNNIQNQEPNGMVPGSIWFPNPKINRTKLRWNKNTEGHPPVWVYAVDDYIQQTNNWKVLKDFFPALVRQITWFENNRKAEGKGYFYNDIVNHHWESGVDEGIRFYQVEMGKKSCIDATSHVYAMYYFAAKWGKQLNVSTSFYARKAEELAEYINNDLYNEAKGSYFDSWSVNEPKKQRLVFENFWPMIVGVCSKERADRLIDDYMLNPKHFFSKHPVTTVSMSDPGFELRMWRGPAWNSMTYWAARACVRYKRYDAAKKILKRALDQSAIAYKKTGTIWEFYHPHGGDQMEVKRKPHTKYNTPSRDYLGHCPLIAMAQLYDQIKDLD